MSPDQQVLARLRLLGESEGGRRLPLRDGYRGMFWLGHYEGGQRTFSDAILQIDRPIAAPGTEVVVTLRPSKPESWALVSPGQRIEMYEGTHLVAEGTIVRS